MYLRPQLRSITTNQSCLFYQSRLLGSQKLFSTVGTISQASDSKSPSPGSNRQRKRIIESVEPQWRAFSSQMQEYGRALNRIKRQLFHHFRIAQDSIREANLKLAEQERDRMDQRLNYDKDIETSGKIENLPSQRELHRRQWSRRLEFYLDSLQETVLTATKALNDVTGYSSIQKLRKSIDLMENNLEESRTSLKILKDRYATAIEQRTESQRELNELLQRKSSWSPADLERFTTLYKNDAVNLKREQDLKEEVKTKEAKQEDLVSDLYHAILTRYHEEQIWSDKIRRTSTWGTFILMGVNILLFLIFQLLLEPWKRRRLTRSFEDKVKRALDQYSVEQSQKLEEFSTTFKDATRNEDAVEPEQHASSLAANQIVETVGTIDNRISDKHSQMHMVWQWLKCFAYKFEPSRVLQPHSQTILSNIELYIYTAVLLILGALSGRVI